MEHHRRGIDNAHIDVFLSPRLRERLRGTVRRLIMEDIQAQLLQASPKRGDSEGLASFRESYRGLFESISEQSEEGVGADHLALLQISVLKCLLQAVSRERDSLMEKLKRAANKEDARTTGRNLEMHDHLVALTRDEHALDRRVLHFLFLQVRKIEDAHVQKMRASVAGEAWPIPRRAYFNRVLLAPDLDELKELIADYPIARLAEGGDTEWLFHTNQCVSTVFQHYLPAWTRFPTHPTPAEPAVGTPLRERRDQGQLKGFLGTEMLLSRFIPEEEYKSGRGTWLDEPRNLRLFLSSVPESKDSFEAGLAHMRESEFSDFPFSGINELATGYVSPWKQAQWRDFQVAVVDALSRCLDLNGLGPRIVLLYWLPVIARELGRPIPLSLVTDFVEGRLARRRVAQRLEFLQLGLDPSAVVRVLERAATRLKRLERGGRSRFLRRYLTDFLVLRRDLKLAYKTYEAMDLIRLLEDPQDVQLSRANTSLYVFSSGEEQRPAKRGIQAHAVIKADVRGSTRVTESLRAKGLNPASHFSRNFFGPVNKLLPDLGAEKLFVEGDAVILGLFELEGEPVPMAVARACALARKILQVVALQNVVNRTHGLPELELGVGISFSAGEPNFLYDEGSRIMISGAINRADRLSACARALRMGGFLPESNAFRVSVVKDRSRGGGALRGDPVLGYNVNGVKLEKAAFFKLQKEIHLHQVRVPEQEMGTSLFFAGKFPDLRGQEHSLVLRYAPVREWDGRQLGGIDPDRGHFFELIVDEVLCTRVRKLAEGDECQPRGGGRG